MTGKPTRKSRPKKKPILGQEWPDSIPRRQLAGADAESLDSMFRRLEKMDFVVRDAPAATERAVTPREFEPTFEDESIGVRLYCADAFELMESAARKCPDGCVDLIVTDPPYFLSNGGITCVAGRMVSVNKGDWDKSRGLKVDHEFTKEWLSLSRRLLKPDAAIWVSGTMHVIYSVGFAMQELGYRILNDVVWWKTNPAPHLACRYLQHATETLIWARKSEKGKHTFHYHMMKRVNSGKQMQNVWRFPSVPRLEKALGGHPTQKPVALMKRIIECSTNPGDLVFDPFMGSGTTGVACVLLGRRFVGAEIDPKYVDIAIRRIRAARSERHAGSLFERTAAVAR